MDGDYIYRCPYALLIEDNWVLDVYKWKRMIDELGILPNEGGYFDQSNWLIEAIEAARAAELEYGD